MRITRDNAFRILGVNEGNSISLRSPASDEKFHVLICCFLIIDHLIHTEHEYPRVYFDFFVFVSIYCQIFQYINKVFHLVHYILIYLWVCVHILKNESSDFLLDLPYSLIPTSYNFIQTVSIER